MRNAISSKLLWALAPAALLAIAAALPPLGCANSAADCALLGLPDGCGTGGNTTSSTTGSGGSTSSTTGTGGSTSSTTGTGGSTSSSSGTGGSIPVSTLPSCVHKHWGDAQSQAIRGLTTDTNGSVLVGDFQGSIDLGKGQLSASPSGSMFVARFDASLGPVWTKAYDAKPQAIAADGMGNVFIAGRLDGPVGFGCGASVLDPTTGGAFFLVKLDADGACVFSRNYAVDVTRASIAVDPSGQAVIAGGAKGTIDFGLPPAITSQGGTDTFVARFDNTGSALAVRAFGSASDDEAAGVVTDTTGNVFIAGTFMGQINFGSGDGTFDSSGHIGAFVAKLSSTLGATWSRAFGSPNDVTVAGVVPLASGGIAVGGTFQDTIKLGGTKTLMNGGLFLAWLDTLGTTSFAKGIAGVASGDISAMAAGPSGDVAVGGSRNGGIYLARLKPDTSTPYEVTEFGTGANHRASAAVFTDATTMLLGGYFDGMLTATDSTTITSEGSDDALLLKVCLPAP